VRQPGRSCVLWTVSAERSGDKRGLDPNVWLHNVEYVAAEKIGVETVTYSSRSQQCE